MRCNNNNNNNTNNYSNNNNTLKAKSSRLSIEIPVKLSGKYLTAFYGLLLLVWQVVVAATKLDLLLAGAGRGSC